MTGDLWGLPRWDWVEFAVLLLIVAGAALYYLTRDTPEDNDD